MPIWGSLLSVQRRYNDHDGVSNHQPHGCLLNRLFRRRSKKTSRLCVTGLCVGNSPGPVNSPHKGPVTRKMFSFDDVIMSSQLAARAAFFTHHIVWWSIKFVVKILSIWMPRPLPTWHSCLTRWNQNNRYKNKCFFHLRNGAAYHVINVPLLYVCTIVQ